MSDATTYEPRFKKLYRDEIVGKLNEEFKYTNPMQVPKLDKVVLNMGVGEAVGDGGGHLKVVYRCALGTTLTCHGVARDAVRARHRAGNVSGAGRGYGP